MANPNVLFSRGSSVSFPSVLKDPNTLYFLTDTKEIYLGSDKYAFGQDITINILGTGDTVADVTWNASTKVFTIILGEAADADSVKAAIAEAVGSCVKTITSDRGSSILVDSSDPQNVKLSLNIAEGQHAGNVTIEECSDGLRANVDIPEETIQGIASDDKVLSIDNKLIRSTLSISTLTENGTVYVVLKGIGGAEISRFDASDFVKDGMLESVSLEYAHDGSNDRILVFTFNTVSGKEVIRVNVQDLVDVYTAEVGGGLRLSNNAFAIDNTIEASDYLNDDVAPAFGETVTLKTIRYNEHGLITGQKNFTFKLPTLVGGSAGGDGKLLTRIMLNASGELEGETKDITTLLSESSTDAQIPTAKAVYDAIEDSVTIWERF